MHRSRSLNRSLALATAALSGALLSSGCGSPSPAGAWGPTPVAVPVAQEAGQDSEELAKAAQNPVADLISLPLQNNTNFDWGPDDDTQNVLNIQPVIPFQLSEDWNLITRTILPVISQPVPGGDDEFGLGDTLFTGFLSPRDSGGLIWGVGPAVLLPTSTDDALGAGEWGAGPAAVVLTMTGPWVVGGLINNVWSFDSGEVNLMTLQPFVNYNLADGWYLVSAPILTANWEADSDERWTVPLGAGFGRTFRAGKLPLNCNVQFYDNLEHPTLGGEWQLRIQVQLLFPK
jgi:hypothetical protein